MYSATKSLNSGSPSAWQSAGNCSRMQTGDAQEIAALVDRQPSAPLKPEKEASCASIASRAMRRGKTSASCIQRWADASRRAGRSWLLQHGAVHHARHEEADRIGDAVGVNALARSDTAPDRSGHPYSARPCAVRHGTRRSRGYRRPIRAASSAARARPGETEQLPDLGPNRPVVRVDDMAAVMLMPGEVHLHDALAAESREIGDRIGAGLKQLTKTLLTSSSRPQPVSSARRRRNSGSSIVDCTKRT